MTEDRLSPAVTDLKRQIVAAAILKEAGRLAENGIIEEKHLNSALHAYRQALDRMKKEER